MQKQQMQSGVLPFAFSISHFEFRIRGKRQVQDAYTNNATSVATSSVMMRRPA